MAYRAKYGPLSMQIRSEWYAAHQMFHLNTINGGKAELEDFLVFSGSHGEEEEASFDDVLGYLQANTTSGQE